MTKRFLPLALIAILLVVTSLAMPAPTRAAEGIELLDSSTQIAFPGFLAFKIKVASTSEVTRIRLHYEVEKMSYARVVSEVWLKFTPGRTVVAQWPWDMRRASLPPGATVKYWWTIEDQADNKLVTPIQKVKFDDIRYSWQELTEDKLTILWYKGSQIFAQKLMAGSQEALERLAKDTGVYPEKHITMYIYANSKDLQGAMVFPREWTGGTAYTKYGTIAIGVSPDNLGWGIKALAHELGHSVIHQITFSPYGNILPTWLDEGLALHAEGEIDPYLEEWLKKAIEKNRLISVRSLSSPFSAIPEQAYISYAQSQSLVDFLITNYGKDKIFKLLMIFKEGATCDEALMQVYDFNQDGLEKLWLQSLPAPGKAQVEPAYDVIIMSVALSGAS
ncbi:MAG: peptidase MA domain-containing protein [Chloroflexi bacterium]|nr:peptidase MA domain-containing protein [Chloroflexota bacterium]